MVDTNGFDKYFLSGNKNIMCISSGVHVIFIYIDENMGLQLVLFDPMKHVHFYHPK